MQAVKAYSSKNNLNIYPTIHFLRPAHISISTLTHKSYTTFSSEVLLIFSKGVKLLIDIGVHDTFLAGKRHPNRKMITFKSLPENFEILDRNGALDQPANVELQHLALSDKEGLKA
jgi:hypothetical protein